MFKTKNTGKQQTTKIRFVFVYVLSFGLFVFGNISFAEVKIKSCYEELHLENPGNKLGALYIFIDQTTFLSSPRR
ncbi:MAG: hypothetical protein GXP19_00755 [Gammaproteobacteria bacterium]|nr:hypothetical protein [Gammaproteobacteria bacterium]